MSQNLEFISTDTAAVEISVAKRTIQEWCKQKRIKACKFGKDWRILRSDWEQFKKRKMQGAA